MIKEIVARFKQGYQTIPYPKREPALPERYRGRLVLNRAICASLCNICVDICPTQAIIKNKDKEVRIDFGRCLFCGDCVRCCPNNALAHLNDYRISANKREDLITDGVNFKNVRPLEETKRGLFKRSLKLRQVSAGGCNACEADINVLNTVVFDLGRFGVQFVASPRHADGLLITGPVPENMKLALQKTYDAVPSPKIVICVGACAISGGPFAGHKETHDGADSILPVDLYIPGCPPHPMTILDGILKLL